MLEQLVELLRKRDGAAEALQDAQQVRAEYQFWLLALENNFSGGKVAVCYQDSNASETALVIITH